ncbi:TIGR02757 family protein [Spongiivirga sp. MCCC 1A20706]|uniref:TIGR02757 family protein n=1 Tax=Spongiivirga sp. MCCC 1A20706 TaxID=3160963 RepID=UPI00397751AF
MNKGELKDFLNEKASFYEHPKFIEDDPIQIPHQFTVKEDIEIAAFLTATIAWGNRKSIINNAKRLMDLMDNSPYNFILNHEEDELDSLKSFVHRTFNGDDLIQFIRSLKHIYTNYDGLEAVFGNQENGVTLQHRIHYLKTIFFDIPHLERTKKHVSDPERGSAAKRINMFLRWMIRPNDSGVDFGLWKEISPALLSCPLDVHSGNVARKLGLLKRKQNDAKALLELDQSLRKMDADDPVKYDFALFGLGVFEKF